MTRLHKWTPALLIMVLLTMHSVASRAEDRIGVAATTKPNADVITAGNSQTLSPGSEVYANETVRTGNLGQADLVFVDKTDLIVGPTSEVQFDKFVYDATGATSNVVFQATLGTFLLVTGTQDNRAYAVNTPYGSLGDASADSARSLVDREARIFQPSLHDRDVPHGRDGGLMSYGPGQNDNSGPGRSDTFQQAGGSTFEVVVAPKGKKRRPDECDVKIRLVSGKGGEYTTNKGKKVPIHDVNQTVCDIGGNITVGSSSTSILAFELAQQEPPSSPSVPPTGGTGPPIVCITQCSP
jgi:hypothetical protein